MQTNGPIHRSLEGRGRTEDRRNKTLSDVWVRRGALAAAPSPASSRSNALPTVTQGPLLVMLSGDCPALWSRITAAALADERVYLLAPPGWGAQGRELAGIKAGRVLVRRVAGLPATALCAGEAAWLWLGSDPTSTRWCFALDPARSAALRHVMLRMFWHEAHDEAVYVGGALRFRPCRPRPFEIPEIVRTSPVSLEAAGAIDPALHGEVVYASTSTREVRARTRAFVPASADTHPLANRLARLGMEVVWSDLGLPPCAIDGEVVVLRATSAKWRLTAQLEGPCADAVRSALRSDPEWRFERSVRLGELGDARGAEVWLPGASAPIALRASEMLDAGVVLAPTLRDAVDASPSRWPEPSVGALSATWRWTVRVPGAPAGLKDDPLTLRWREIDQQLGARIASMRSAMETMGAPSDGSRSAEVRLRGERLGHSRWRVAAVARLEEVSARRPLGRSRDEAERAIDAMNTLEREYAALAREAQAFEASEALDLHERASSEMNAERRSVTAEADEEAQRAGLDRAPSSTDGERAKPSDSPVRDGRARGTPRREGEIFVPDLRPIGSTALPDDALPSVGRLLVRKEGRVLAIARWEDLEVGEQEAMRLNATLMAEEEAP
jgi:hypothetical protein